MFEWFSLLKKGRNTTGNPCTWMQIKQLLTGPDNVPEEISEDIQLMRGSCRSERQSKILTWFQDVYSRMTMILLSNDRFHKRPKDVSIDIDER